MPLDVEEAELRQRLQGPAQISRKEKEPLTKVFNLAYRIIVIGASLYGLIEYGVFHQIMKGSNVNHGWFKLGLAASVGKWK